MYKSTQRENVLIALWQWIEHILTFTPTARDKVSGISVKPGKNNRKQFVKGQVTTHSGDFSGEESSISCSFKGGKGWN